MIKVKEVIVVEGVYDKIKLDQIIKGTIVTTNGFSIFKDTDKLNLIRKLAEKNGVVILTDSDRAGFQIRNHIKKHIPVEHIKHAYIPGIKGIEKRKKVASKEGLLGVEGIKKDVIIETLIRSGCTVNNESIELNMDKEITKTHLYEDGLTGNKDSRLLRNKLNEELELPQRMSTNALLDFLNQLYTYEEYKELINKIKD
jgi:ribonuclease M5